MKGALAFLVVVVLLTVAPGPSGAHDGTDATKDSSLAADKTLPLDENRGVKHDSDGSKDESRRADNTDTSGDKTVPAEAAGSESAAGRGGNSKKDVKTKDAATERTLPLDGVTPTAGEQDTTGSQNTTVTGEDGAAGKTAHGHVTNDQPATDMDGGMSKTVPNDATVPLVGGKDSSGSSEGRRPAAERTIESSVTMTSDVSRTMTVPAPIGFAAASGPSEDDFTIEGYLRRLGVTLGDKLGEGGFGVVYHATYTAGPEGHLMDASGAHWPRRLIVKVARGNALNLMKECALVTAIQTSHSPAAAHVMKCLHAAHFPKGHRLRDEGDPGLHERVLVANYAGEQLGQLDPPPSGSQLRSVIRQTLRVIELMNGVGIDVQVPTKDYIVSPSTVTFRARWAHRDLKPANIVVAVDNGVYHATVIDFGISEICPGSDEPNHQHILASDVALARLRVQGGATRAYSPLYGQAALQLGPRLYNPCRQNDDMYSLGAIWFDMVTGCKRSPPPAGQELATNFANYVDECGRPDGVVDQEWDLIEKMFTYKWPDGVAVSAAEAFQALEQIDLLDVEKKPEHDGPATKSAGVLLVADSDTSNKHAAPETETQKGTTKDSPSKEGSESEHENPANSPSDQGKNEASLNEAQVSPGQHSLGEISRAVKAMEGMAGALSKEVAGLRGASRVG